jgi:hypothetical protein
MHEINGETPKKPGDFGNSVDPVVAGSSPVGLALENPTFP